MHIPCDGEEVLFDTCRRFNSLVELDTKEEADAARNLIEGPSLGYRVGLDV